MKPKILEGKKKLKLLIYLPCPKKESINLLFFCSDSNGIFTLTFPVYFFPFSSREYASTIDKPFKARYDPYTQSIELLDSKSQIMKNMRAVNREIRSLTEAMEFLDL